jgi:hypothetical protein
VKHQYISLGSACDPVLMFEMLGMKEVSMPFDWLWNLDLGLKAVCEIIENDFAQISDRDGYAVGSHYRLDREVLVYKAFPTIIHMHSDPLANEADHASLLRRMERFRESLRSGDHLHFVYYKHFNEEHLRGSALTIEDTVRRMFEESERFIDLVSRRRALGRRNLSLLLVLQTHEPDAQAARKVLRKLKPPSSLIKTGYTITRRDKDPPLMTLWRGQWFWNLVLKSRMPPPMMWTVFRRQRQIIRSERGAV